MTDADLIALAKNVVSFFRGKFPGGITAEDARQDAIVLLLEWDRSFPDRGHLVRKVRGVLQDRYGKQWRQDYAHATVSMDGPLGTEAEEDGISGDTASDVALAITLLPPRQRNAIRLHLRGMTQAAIAKTLGYSQSYVCQLLKAAREKLRELLNEDYG